MTIHQVTQAVRMSRVLAAEQASWYAPALFHARIVLTENCPTLAAIDDGWRVYFNPTMVQAMIDSQPWEDTLYQLGFLWIHEISHVLRDHSGRFLAVRGVAACAVDPLAETLPESESALAESSKRWAEVHRGSPDMAIEDHEALAFRWNLAADCEINDLGNLGPLQAPLLFQPVTPQTLGQPAHKIAEFYYQHLHNSNRLRLDYDWVLSEGSGVDGIRRAWELPLEDPQATALTELEIKECRREVARKVLANSRQVGNDPGSLRRWAEDLADPKADWRHLLRHGVRRALSRDANSLHDFSYQRPHRRSTVYAPFMRPSLVSQARPSVACVVDTSGSMSSSELGRSLSEVHAVLRLLGTAVTIIPCDTASYPPIHVRTRADVERLKQGLPGGGGTNLVVGIEAALTLRPAPDVILVLTDGYTNYPDKRYAVPVFFGIFTSGAERDCPDRAKPPAPVWGPRDYTLICQ